MAEIIDVLMPKISLSPYFTVDTTGPLSVAVIDAAVPLMTLYSGDASKPTFQRGDNVVMLSFGYFIPDNFISYELSGPTYAVPSWKLYMYKTVAAASVPLNQFGVSGTIQSPFPNYEMAMGIFLDVNTIAQEAFRLQVAMATNNRISMVGAPAVLNGLVFHVVPFVKILHNFPLVV
jgi:hypothetical protein